MSLSFDDHGLQRRRIPRRREHSNARARQARGRSGETRGQPDHERVHLVKLRALACVIAAPSEFALTLPEVDREEQLVALRLAASCRSRSSLPSPARLRPNGRNGIRPGRAATSTPGRRRAGTSATRHRRSTGFRHRNTGAGSGSRDRGLMVRVTWCVPASQPGSSPVATRSRSPRLMAANALDASSVLHPGQILRLP